MPSRIFATVDDQTDFALFFALSEFLEKGLEPNFDLLDCAGSATITKGINQRIGPNRDGDKACQRLLHSLQAYWISTLSLAK